MISTWQLELVHLESREDAVMTPALQKAFDEASKLPNYEQEALGRWILEEIGKEKPITTGIVVRNSQIERVKVLIFREVRGWEVRHDFFTEQFVSAQLDSSHNLDRYIDNVTGATLSVRAVTKLARLALYLHEQVTDAET